MGLASEDRLHRLERLTSLPLLILAVALIPLLVLPLIADLSEGVKDVFLALDWFIWTIFAADFAAKLAVAPRRFAYVRSHWLEAAMVALPFLRPLRVARLLGVARIAVALGFNVTVVREIADSRGTRFIVATLVVITTIGALLVFLAERQGEGANITSFADALWWTLTTMTTVGYGDHYPVTPMGRGLAAVLMLVGIAAVSVVTASIAALLVRDRDDQPQLGDLLAKIEELQAEVRALSRERSG